jgi:hypothetical protein
MSSRPTSEIWKDRRRTPDVIVRTCILTALRGSLIIAAVGWGISIMAVILSDETAFRYLSGMAGETIPSSPMLGYWLKMTGIAFTFIGCLFAYCGAFPLRSVLFTGALLAFNLICGIALIAFGISYSFEDHVYWSDGCFGIAMGAVGLAALCWLQMSEPST